MKFIGVGARIIIQVAVEYVALMELAQVTKIETCHRRRNRRRVRNNKNFLSQARTQLQKATQQVNKNSIVSPHHHHQNQPPPPLIRHRTPAARKNITTRVISQAI